MLGDERKAREIALFRQGKFRDVKLAKQQASQAREHVRADRRGQEERCRSSSRPTCRVRTRRWPTRCRSCRPTKSRSTSCTAAVGGITESDINLALASKAVDHRLQHARRCGGAQARRIGGRRDPLLQHHLRGGRRDQGGAVRHAGAGEARKACSAWSRSGRCSRSRRSARSPVAMVLDGLVRRSAKVRLLRDNVVIHDGELDSLKRFKDDVREVKAGLRVRPVAQGLQRHQSRRPARGIRGRRGGADACEAREGGWAISPDSSRFTPFRRS